MSHSLSITKTIGSALSFAFGKWAAVTRIGWFPMAVMLGLTALIGWFFFQPIVLAYGELISSVQSGADTAAAMEQYNEAILAMIESGAGANLALGYTLIMILMMYGSAIIYTAYSRMMVNGDHYTGLIYFQFGAREFSVGTTYVLVMILSMIVITIVVIPVAIVAGLLAAVFAENSAALTGVVVFAVMVATFIFMIYLLARLSLALPISAIEGGTPIGKAWQLSKGNGASLTLALILGYILLFVFWVLAFLAFSLFAGVVGLALGAISPQLSLIVTGVIGLLGYVVMVCIGNAYFIGIFASAYMQLNAGDNEAHVEPTMS